MPPTSRPAWFHAAAAALVLAIGCTAAVSGDTPPNAVATPPPAPVELVESVPIESNLGNPSLRPAAKVWLELVKSATKSLDFEEMYLSNQAGEPLEPILTALVEAAKRGVRVRILLDAKMYKTYSMPADSLGRIPGIAVRIIDFGKISGGIQHAKYILVDGKATYLGSQNMDWRSLEHIHELGVLIHDEHVTEMFQPVFEMDWGAAEVQATAGDSSRMIGVPAAPAAAQVLPIRIVQSAGDTVLVWPSWNPRSFSPDTARWDRDAVVQSIDRADHEIVIQSLRYSTALGDSTDDTIDRALRRAAARGVSVKMLISDWQAGSKDMKMLESLSQQPHVEVKLSPVKEWSHAYIPFARVEHAKYMVVDSMWTWVGTSNWEPSYFHRVRNVAVTMKNRPLALQARTSFEAGWSAPTALPVTTGAQFAPRVHGETAPPGRTKYGN